MEKLQEALGPVLMRPTPRTPFAWVQQASEAGDNMEKVLWLLEEAFYNPAHVT